MAARSESAVRVQNERLPMAGDGVCRIDISKLVALRRMWRLFSYFSSAIGYCLALLASLLVSFGIVKWIAARREVLITIPLGPWLLVCCLGLIAAMILLGWLREQGERGQSRFLAPHILFIALAIFAVVRFRLEQSAMWASAATLPVFVLGFLAAREFSTFKKLYAVRADAMGFRVETTTLRTPPRLGLSGAWYLFLFLGSRVLVGGVLALCWAGLLASVLLKDTQVHQASLDYETFAAAGAGLLLVPIVGLALSSVSDRFLKRRRRYAAVGQFTRLHAKNPRRPILYLRAFSDDGLAVKQPGDWLRKIVVAANACVVLVEGGMLLKVWSVLTLISFPQVGDLLENVIADALWRVAPVVGIGGAAEGTRQWSDDAEEKWLKEVGAIAETSVGLLLLVADTPNVIKELEYIFSRIKVPRSVLVFHPDSLEAVNRWFDFKGKTGSITALPNLSEDDRARALYLLRAEDGRWSLILSKKRDGESYAIGGALVAEWLAGGSSTVAS